VTPRSGVSQTLSGQTLVCAVNSRDRAVNRKAIHRGTGCNGSRACAQDAALSYLEVDTAVRLADRLEERIEHAFPVVWV